MLKIKLSAVIITFYPDLDKLVLHINQIINHVDLLIIWDNTPLNSGFDYFKVKNICNDKIQILGETKNLGIGYAVNKAIDFSISYEMTHLMTLDQDSLFKEVDFIRFKQAINYYIQDDYIAVFAPNIVNVFSKNQVPHFCAENEIEYVEKVISSGSVYKLNIFEQTGLLREDLFIDEVDFEYCYRVNKMGFKVAIISNVLLFQSFSEMKQIKNLFYITNYSSFRLYHIIRNGIIIKKEYPEIQQSWFKLILNSIFIRMIKILLFENNKINKCYAIILGVLDGIKNNCNERSNFK